VRKAMKIKIGNITIHDWGYTRKLRYGTEVVYRDMDRSSGVIKTVD
jgi:hypothetical protein